jgi:hypothetical protein
VSPHVLTADHALEQAAGGAVVEPREGREGRETVGEQPSIDGHEAAAPCQVGEPGPFREMHERGSEGGSAERVERLPPQPPANNRAPAPPTAGERPVRTAGERSVGHGAAGSQPIRCHRGQAAVVPNPQR